MKEKILIIIGLFVMGYGLYGYFSVNMGQQYNYNGGLIKNVYAATEADNNSAYTNDWDKDNNKVIINLSKENVTPSTSSVVVIPPPPRHSH